MSRLCCCFVCILAVPQRSITALQPHGRLSRRQRLPVNRPIASEMETPTSETLYRRIAIKGGRGGNGSQATSYFCFLLLFWIRYFIFCIDTYSKWRCCYLRKSRDIDARVTSGRLPLARKMSCIPSGPRCVALRVVWYHLARSCPCIQHHPYYGCSRV